MADQGDGGQPAGRGETVARRPRRLALVGVALGALLAVAVAIAVSGDRRPEGLPLADGKGRTAPAFSVPDLRHPDKAVELAAFRGRPVVLNFWASWCVPCRREMPGFQDVAEQVGGRVAFVGINHQDGRSAGLRLLEETGVTYPAGFDPQGKVAGAYALIGMPSTVFISPTGRVVATRTGEMSRAQLRRAIDELFG